MKAGTYTGPGVPGPQLQALRGAVQQHPSQPRVPSQGALRPSPPMRPNHSGAGNFKAPMPMSSSQLFDGARFGGSLDGCGIGSAGGSISGSDGGSIGGSWDGESIHMYRGYSWQVEPAPVNNGALDSHIQSFSLIKEIGEGGSGKAYLVTGKADGKKYVAKQIVCLGDHYKSAPASYALQETRLLFHLQHPHICALVDFYSKSQNFYIVLEYCEQGDLGRHISGAIRRVNVKFDSERVYTWWYQMLDAMDFCHSKGVLHRDLKPKNIFIDESLNVKVGDFGVSALVSSPPALERVGTVTYHSPEIQKSLRYSVKSDVWAIGVIMWEVMQLRPSGGEPINLSMIDVTAILPIYGQPALELLSLHLLDHPDQRPQAGALKDKMMQLLQEPTRSAIAARANTSSAMTRSDATKQADWMRPRTVHVPDTLKDTSAVSRRDGGFRSQPAEPETVMEAQNQPEHKNDNPEVRELSKDLGMYVIAGTGGELGAWKIASLPKDKPAAKCDQISLGEYLWEINGKIVFGMPFQLISSLIKGTSPEVKVGVKAGLSLTTRTVVIRRDGNYKALEKDPVVKQVSPSLSPKSPQISVISTSLKEASPIFDPISQETAAEISNFYTPASAVEETETRDRVPLPSQWSAPTFPTSQDTAAEISQFNIPASAVEETDTIDRVSLPSQGSAPNFPASPDVPVSEVELLTTTNRVSSHSQRSAPAPLTTSKYPGGDVSTMIVDSPGSRNIFEPSPLLDAQEPLAGHIPSELASEGQAARAATSDATPSIQSPLEESESDTSFTFVVVRGHLPIAGDGQYNGEHIGGKPFGVGTATWPQQGHTYVGEWRNGMMHGLGTATYLNGDRYDGEWVNGKRSGLGRYVHGSGDIYEGLWSNERKHGLGVDSFSDGRGYRGDFMDNKFAGVGSYFTVNGAIYQGDWFQGKAHGTGVSTSQDGQPAYVQYNLGNLIRKQSEPFDAKEHEEKHARVEKLSRAAVAIAYLARRVASLMQGQIIEPPMLEEIEEQELRACLSPITGTSILGKALVLLAGVHSIVQEDSSLIVTKLEGSQTFAARPMTPGDIVFEVASRSCSWYKGMTLEEIMSLLQSNRLVVGLKSQGTPPWAKPRQLEITIGQSGFVV